MTPLCTLLAALAFVSVLSFTAFPARAADDLLITELMADNESTLADEDGDFPDWVEIYNAGIATVDLNGWYLTDNAGNLTKWRFPATNLAANAHIIVFASNKDRRIPGRQLHSNFQLNNSGEFVGLVKPDGTTIQSSYSPSYPVQAADISYGIAVTTSSLTLISNGAAGKFTVPINGNQGIAWTLPNFNDTGWAPVNNGVGFEGQDAGTVGGAAIANSDAEFSGTQGQGGWFYGYWDKKADANGTYESADFTQFLRGTGNQLNATNFFDGSAWKFPTPNPPWTSLSRSNAHPTAENGNGSLPVHWAVRRYVSETNGQLRISGTLACNSSNGTCGDGTVARIFVDGVEAWSRHVRYESIGYSVIVDANLGSIIDFAIDPGDANNDSCDNTTFTAIVRTTGAFAAVADSLADWPGAGVQGQGGWYYGSLIKTNAAVAYATNRFSQFPSGSGPHSSGNFWNGEAWQWFDGDPPFDYIGQTLMRPSVYSSGSSTNAFEHWVIRRWVSEVSGTAQIDWHFSKHDLTGQGTVARVFHNGTERDSITVISNDFAGGTKTIGSFPIQRGDIIDFVVQPGTFAANFPNAFGDICNLNATIFTSTTVSNQFISDVGLLMTNINASAYLRLPFSLATVQGVNSLRLRIKYDDGFVAYLNGSPVASRNTPIDTNWNSTAASSRVDSLASQYEEIDLSEVAEFLVAGNNVLALHGMNVSAADQDFLLTAELIAGYASLNPSVRNYFSSPTPGSINGFGSPNLGPLVTSISHAPHDPADNEDLYVTAHVAPTLYPIANVRLYYRVMFGSESNLVMLDDGLHADGVAGDGVYGAAVPNTVSRFGEMIRYYIIATSTNGATTRQPPFPHPSFSSQYYGAVVRNPALTNPLPVMHLFIPSGTLVNAGNDANGRYQCSIYWAGEFYDNVGINRHGQSSSGFPKKSYDIDFNGDHTFKWHPDQPRVDDLNLLTTYPDKAHMRNMLAYDVCKDAGSPYHFVVPVRVQTNGGFYGDWHIVENGDANFLERNGRDPDGALYKMYNTFTTIGNTVIGPDPNAEKKTRKYEDSTDLVVLFTNITSGTTVSQVRYMYDNINVSEVVNTMAARSITSDWDCCHKNYYFYRDSNGTGEWEAMPWDLDLSFGRNWHSTLSYWDPKVYPGNRIWGNWDNNSFFQLVLNQPTSRGIAATRQMYLRRVRTLADELQQTNGTPAEMRNFERQIDGWAALIGPDAALDLTKWGTWGDNVGANAGPIPTNSVYYHTLPQSVAEMKTNYLVARRQYIFDQRFGVGAEFPDAQPTNVTIQIGPIDYNPSSGNQAEEYITLINTNNIAVDISGWTLSNAIMHTFQGGVVIPSASVAPSNRVYVVPNKKAFRARATGPRGGQSLFVEGQYKGQLSARGETIILADKRGRVVATNAYAGNPSAPQQYLRITEIMYHPPNPSSGPYEAEDFEYIELKNIGPAALDLTGVHFRSGVEFSFTGSTVTNLAAGQYVLVVRNIAAFTARYGGGFNIAGQYVGILANEGEEISLYDQVGESILDFEFDNAWYPVTDGPGASLVIVNENAPFSTWSVQESWRPSYHDFGGPGQVDPLPAAVAPILINEVLSHTDPPLVDAIELLNTNSAAVNIGGWFLTDDFATPKKYRIPNGTILQPGGYLAFDETQFNTPSNAPGAFSFSSKGDEAYIFSGDGTNLTGYLHGYEFGAAENGISFGRHVNSQGDVHFVAQSARTLTPAGPNAPPKVGPVIISEISYHPGDDASGADNVVDEFIELANVTGSPVTLFNPTNAANTWRLRSAVDFDFPTGVTIPAGGHILVVSFNPTNTPVLDGFRDRLQVGPAVSIFGPYDGKLDNTNESVRLYRPDAPDGTDVPYILVDQVDYSHALPWPAAADGIGPSLQKLLETAYGNDPTNWTGVGPSAGGPYLTGGTPPTISPQPANASAILGYPGMLSVTASGTAPLFYQWRFKGGNIAGAVFSTLTLPSVQLSNAGPYSVIVYNGSGSTESSNAVLTVLIPAEITRNPTNILARVRPDPAAANPTNVTFFAAANSTTPLRYQWRFNGTEIDGATNGAFTVTNVQVSSAGEFQCAITDDVGTIFSAPAMLIPLVTPVIAQAPLNQTVPAGGPVSVSVTLGDGYPPPFSYTWRDGSQPIVTVTSNSKTNVLNFLARTNASLSTNTYRIVITNLAHLAPGINTTFLVTTIADIDKDGIPDAYESSIGLDPNSPADAQGDLDNDTMTNLEEYLAGTDPANAASYLRIDHTATPGITTLQLGAVANRTYTIQSSGNLNATGTNGWSRVADIVAKPADRVETIVLPNGATNRYFRVRLPAQP